MKHFVFVLQSDARRDFRRCVNYLLYRKKNLQAAENFVQDFDETLDSLSDIADSLKMPDSDILRARNLKRLNFIKHDYFLLFRVDGAKAIVTNIFHGSEDF